MGLQLGHQLRAEDGIFHHARQRNRVVVMALFQASEVQREMAGRHTLFAQIVVYQCRVEVAQLAEADNQHRGSITQVAGQHHLWSQASRPEGTHSGRQQPVPLQRAMQRVTGRLPIRA